MVNFYSFFIILRRYLLNPRAYYAVMGLVIIIMYSKFFLPLVARRLLLLTLAVGLGGVVTTVDDEVLGAVVELASEVALDDGLGAVGVALLGVQGGTRLVGDHGV